MSESILFDILQKSKDNKQIISVWKYNEDDGFWAGYVKDFNDELVIIQHYTKYGKSDGIIIEKIEEIKSIDFDDDYAKTLKYIIENSSLIDKEDEFKVSLNDNENWQEEILKQVEGNKEIIVSVEINGSDSYSGFILIVSETDFIINCVGKFGEDEGKVIYKIEDVTSVRVNDIEDRKRRLLYNWRKASL